MPQVASGYARARGSPARPPRPPTGRSQRPLIRAGLDLSPGTRPSLLGHSLEGHSLGFVVSRAHPAQETGTPDSSGTVLMHNHSTWSPRHVAPPTFRGSCSFVTSSPSARPVCSPGDRHSPPCPPPGPLTPLTGSEAPSLVTTATSLLESLLLQMSFAKKSPSHAGWGVTAKAGGHPTLLAAPLCPQQLATPRSPHTSQPGPDLRTGLAMPREGPGTEPPAPRSPAAGSCPP